MQKKHLNYLPKKITEHSIGEFLSEKDKSALTATSKQTQGLFQPNRLQMMVNKLLLQVMQGEQDKAEKILKLHPGLAAMTGTATDYSGQRFNTTPFQFALWALDSRYMCNMMLDCLPNNPQGQAIKQKLQTQFIDHFQNGVQYTTADGVTINETHYNYSHFLDVIKTYVDNYTSLTTGGDRAINALNWIAVGHAQRYVPAHVAQHYCERCEPSETSKTFFSQPSFTKEKFDRSLQIVIYGSKFRDKWFDTSTTSSLGIDMIIWRGDQIGAAGWGDPGAGECHRAVLLDLAALTALFNQRINDLDLIMQRLELPVQQLDVEREPSSCVIL